MDWIHCNCCFNQLNPGIDLEVTTCGHMICNKCLENGIKRNPCSWCKNKCDSVALNPDLTDEVKDFFTDPLELFSKCIKIMEFQKMHRTSLIEHWIQMTKKYQVAKDQIRKLTEVITKLQSSLHSAKEQNKYLKSIVRNAQSSQPTSPFAMPYTPDRGGALPPPRNFSFGPSTSTPINSKFYNSNLVTSDRLRKPRYHNSPNGSQKSGISGHLFRPNVLSPITPGSVGYLSTPASSGCSQSSTPSVTRDFVGMNIHRPL